MKIIEELLSTLNVEVSVRDVRLGLFYPAVSTRNCGLAATLPPNALKQERLAVRERGLLLGKSALELA